MEKFKCLFSIGIFGALGGISRYLIGLQLNYCGDLLVNLLGCFLLGFLTYFWLNFHEVANWLSLGLGTGFVGSFTTFSSFCLDNLKLLLAGQNLALLFYLLISIAGGWIAALVGIKTGTRMGQRLNQSEGDDD